MYDFPETKRVNSRLTLNFLIHDNYWFLCCCYNITQQQQPLPLLILTILLLLVIFMLLLSSPAPAPVLSFFMVCPTFLLLLAKQKEFLCCRWTLVLPHIHNIFLSTPHPRWRGCNLVDINGTIYIVAVIELLGHGHEGMAKHAAIIISPTFRNPPPPPHPPTLIQPRLNRRPCTDYDIRSWLLCAVYW